MPPQECMCFKSAMLPLRLSYTVSSEPVQWRPADGQLPQDFLTHSAPDLGSPHASTYGAVGASAAGTHPDTAALMPSSGGGAAAGAAAGGGGCAEAAAARLIAAAGNTGIVQQGDQVR
eukprot:366332-Chlamydomonas_euryale.AAC.15